MGVLLLVLLVAMGAAGCAAAESGAPPDAAASAGGGDPSTSASSPTAAPRAPGTYLGLGDSLAVGVGASEPSRGGYVARIHGAVRTERLINLAVSGETSASFLSGGQLEDALRHIARAEPHVQLVTLDIGGNDLLRLLGSDPCASEPNSAACRRAVAGTLDRFEANYRTALRALRDALNESAPDAVLAAMTYFNPFSGTDARYEAGGELALLGRDLRLSCPAADRDSANRGLNDIIACVARDFDARVADIHQPFEGLGLALTHIGAEDIHANDRGYELIAEELLLVIRRERQ